MSNQLTSSSADESTVPERFDPAAMRGEIIEAEHLARYRWASALAEGRRVLDAGCGTAYGSALLAQSGATEVVGVDVSAEILDSVRSSMPPAVALQHGDVMALAFEDSSFDLVICFEVIEHLEDPAAALDEFRRVLRPDGILAVSSPNREVYPPGNPHHLHEYTPNELEEALSHRFEQVRLERQHTWITSGVLSDERFVLGTDESVGPDVQVRKLIRDKTGSELYTVALASDSELPTIAATLELAPPVELRKWDALWHEQSDVLKDQAQMLSRQAALLAEHEAYAERTAQEIGELRRQLGRAESKLAAVPELDAQLRELLKLNDDLLALNNELQVRQVTFDELVEISRRYTVLVESNSWRLTRPLRRMAVLVRTLVN